MSPLITKHYFSAIYFSGAKTFAQYAQNEENKFKDDIGKRDHPTHRVYVVSSIILATSFLESLINELFQKVCDNPTEYQKIFSMKQISTVKEYWDSTTKANILTKYQNFLEACEQTGFDTKHDPKYINTRLSIRLRNSLIHYKTNINISKSKPKSLGAFPNKKFRNPLYRQSFDDHTLNKILSSNTAKQIINYYKTFTNDFFNRINIKPNYSHYSSVTMI